MNLRTDSADVEEREFWDEYQHAFEDALRRTSTPWAPWYAIPADDKPYMRYRVADIVVKTLERLELSYPSLNAEKRAELEKMRTLLRG